MRRLHVTQFWLKGAAGYAVAVALPMAVAMASAQFALPPFIIEHLIIVVVVGLAIAHGRGAATLAAVVGVIGDNLLLREPFGRPAISGARDVIDLVLFVGVAVVVSWLVDRQRLATAAAIAAAERERAAREELDRVIATITHDLATPLGAIQGTIQFAQKHAAQSEVDTARLLARVETAAARATSLLRALQDAKSIEQHSLSLDVRPMDFREAVEPTVRMLDRVSDRHPIALAMDGEPLLIEGDADHLRRVVENLITNAIKYSPGGGAIEVWAGQDNGEVVLTVRDHGIGIAAESRQRLFELGFRAPAALGVAPGLGLGLYTAAEVVRRHGGDIAAAPGSDRGSIFTVRLPRARRPPEPRATSP